LTGLLTGSAAWAQAAGPFSVFTVSPCRVLDTRFAGALGPVPSGGTLSILVSGDLTAGGTINQGGASTCNVPDGATGVFINIVAVTPSGAGYLTVYPSSLALPPSSSTLNFATGQNIANAALVALCTPFSSCNRDLSITMGQAGAHLVIDVTGFLWPVGQPISIDIQGPTVSLSSPATGTTYTTAQTVNINATASDNVGVTRVEFFDGSTLKATVTSPPYTYAWPITSASNGTHTWTARAWDLAGNGTTSAASTVTVNIGAGDTVLPTVS